MGWVSDADTDLKLRMLRNAEELRRLHQRVHETHRLRDRGPEHRQRWATACEEFHRRYDALAFPGGYGGVLERIVAGDHGTIDAALDFVECRPYFFRSGYMYKDLLRKLKRAPLTGSQARRRDAAGRLCAVPGAAEAHHALAGRNGFDLPPHLRTAGAEVHATPRCGM